MLDVEEPLNHLQTLRDYVRWSASRFRESGLVFGHGTDNAIDEAAALVLHSLHLPPDFPEEYWQARVTPTEGRAVLERVKRRIDERLPLPYLTREAWFAGLPFYVDARVLVPRSPIAEMIEAGFSSWSQTEGMERVLDLGTGSGCIAIACALAFEETVVDASDVSEDALEVASINVQRHQLGDRVRLIQADVFDGLPSGRRYDLIVANPPYVDAEDMARLPPEYRHEPRLGLAAGEDGLEVVHRVLADAADWLTADGLLVVEVGNSGPAVEAAWPGVPFLWIEFERGGHGVFALTSAELAEHAALFKAPRRTVAAS